MRANFFYSRLGILALGVLMAFFAGGCALYSSDLAPDPVEYEIREGEVFSPYGDRKFYVQRITNQRVTLRWTKGNGTPLVLPFGDSESMGNGVHLRVIKAHEAVGTATIERSHTDRRGLFGWTAM